MSNYTPPTIGSLLLPGGVFHEEAWKRLQSILAPVSVAAAAMSQRIPWSFVENEVKTKIVELLDIKLSTVIVAAWEKAEELEEFGDREKHPPEVTIIIELVEHTIDADYHPSLDFIVNEQELVFQLDVLLSLIVKGLILKIQEGRVQEVQAGTITGKGKLESAGLTILEKESEPIEMRSRWVLDETAAPDGDERSSLTPPHASAPPPVG